MAIMPQEPGEHQAAISLGLGPRTFAIRHRRASSLHVVCQEGLREGVETGQYETFAVKQWLSQVLTGCETVGRGA